MIWRIVFGCFCLSLFLAATPLIAQVITVDITDGDLIDVDPGTATVEDLPGPDGHISFSEAMIASNNTPGLQTIGFAIPTSEWTYLSSFYPGRAVIHGLSGASNANSPVVIDGTTQTAFTGDTNPYGHEVVILWGGSLYFPADNCRISGLDQTSLYIEGSNAIVTNNSVMGINLYGGNGARIFGNTGGGYVQIDQSSHNIVTGNTLDRVRVLGAMAAGNPAMDNQIGGPKLADRNFIMGKGIRNSQGIPGGFAVQIFEAIGTIVENNWIGTTPNGLAQGNPYTTIGVWLNSENYFTVIRNNRIAGIRALAVPLLGPSYFVGTAIQIDGTGSGVSITGNKIGLDTNNEPTLGGVTGISMLNYYLGPVQDVTIGGISLRSRSSNEIAGNLGAGVSIGNSYSGVTISGNSLHDNGGLGIDLIDAGFITGVSPNDLLDTDSGANGLQNYPVVASAELQPKNYDGRRTRVVGSLNSNPFSAFVIEFFGSPECDISGYGEASTYLGSYTVTTNSSGNATFKVTLPANALIAEGWVVTATATNSKSGSTSEFSACVEVSIPGL